MDKLVEVLKMAAIVVTVSVVILALMQNLITKEVKTTRSNGNGHKYDNSIPEKI